MRGPGEKLRIKGRERGKEVTGAVEEAKPHHQKLTPTGERTNPSLTSWPSRGQCNKGSPGRGREVGPGQVRQDGKRVHAGPGKWFQESPGRRTGEK